jgi:hypothetical protein
MKLADLLAQPHPWYVKVPNPPLKEETAPVLPMEWNGSPLTRRQSYCLLTHVLSVDVNAVLPVDWRDPLGLAILDLGNSSGLPWMSSPAMGRLAGPRTIAALKERLRTGRADALTVFRLLDPLLEDDWLAALPFVTESLRPRQGLISYLRPQIERRLERVRTEQDIGPDVWELLTIPQWQMDSQSMGESRKVWVSKFEEFMQRGLRFSARDFRWLIEHPIHGDILKALVLQVHSSGATRLAAWPFPLSDADFVSVAHPMCLDPAERERWPREAPFDQWKGSGEAPKLDWAGLTSAPADLMLHLEAHGWRRGIPGADGVIRSHRKFFSDLGQRAVLEYTGIPTAYGGRWSRQTITACRFEHEDSGAPVQQANPIAASVVKNDLEGLRK